MNSLNYEKYYNEVTKPAIEAALKIEKTRLVKKACEWLYVQLNEGNMECNDMEKFIDNFKKEMEER